MRTPLEALALRQRKLAPDLNVAPEARAMFGQAEALLFLEFAIPIVIGYAVYRVVVHVLLDKPRPKHRPPPTVADTPAEPDATGMPMATSVPAATSAPATTVVPMATAVPKARRYPNQTCDDDMLDRLEGEKDKLCYPADGYAAICGGGTSKSKKPLIPCSAIKRGIEQRNLCLKQRSLVQKECFGGKPDAGHKTAIDLVENGIKACEALKLINCAKGHPMAGL
jgi:hypothetical protein